MDQQSFFFQAVVYLAAAVLFVPLAKKLGFGSVLGYLIAGIVIGPAVLGFVGEEGQDILHFAEFGVVMMLFLIGLELEPELLWRLRKSIIGLGGLQVVITTLIFAAIAYALGLNPKAALALGMILSLSSTAIVMQSLTEKGLMKSVSGQSSFSVLLFQDIAVIPMLALFPLLAPVNNIAASSTSEHSTWVSGQPGWIQTIIVLLTITSIIVAGRFFVRPMLRIIARTRMREVFTASALLLIVGIAVLMEQVGLSPALGTFMAGVVLANSEYRHELESDIEPFKGLLLGLFFIAVGASLDFNLIILQPLLITGLVFSLIIVKGVVLFLLGKFFNIGKDQNLIFSFALSQVGEFAFVLFSFSSQEGIFPQQTINLMMAVVAISMALTPLLMMINERWILPNIGTHQGEEKPSDEIDEKNPVIVAGFGHFGSTVGRFLRANNIKATYLDIDSDRVDVLRRMGFKVFYGDASRYDLLQAAGADQAKLIIIAIDSAEKRLEMIETIKKHFPNLHMLVRASNRYDAYDQMNAGILRVYRETVDTALRIGVDAMVLLGNRAYTANRLARTFLKHDEANLKKLAAIRDPDEYILAAKNYIEEIEIIVQSDMKDAPLERDAGWDVESLREEVRVN
jgi:monovalent cation:proton antiporter-2 (CPA2) family protein